MTASNVSVNSSIITGAAAARVATGAAVGGMRMLGDVKPATVARSPRRRVRKSISLGFLLRRCTWQIPQVAHDSLSIPLITFTLL